MQKPNRNPFRLNIIPYILVILALMGVFQMISGSFNQSGVTKQITTSEFIAQLNEGKISEIELQIGEGAYNVRGKYKTSTVQKDEETFLSIFQGTKNTTKFETKILGNDSTLALVTELAMSKGIKVKTLSESQVGMWLSFIPYVILLVPMMFIMTNFFQQMGGGSRGMMDFTRKVAKDVSKSKVKVRFTDVAGADEEKAELEEMVDFLKDPKRFTALGARIPAGVLLEGPPGTGKTLLAKAVAGEAGVPFYSMSGSEFVEMFVGVGAKRVRELFENAKKNAPAIIFIDEIDAVGRQRGAGMGGGHDEREQTLNQLLVEMDGFSGSEGIIVIAATNRSDVLDPALLRPGRFDRKILVGNPDVKGREEILKVHARNKKLASNIDLKVVAQQTPGFSGAELENLLNEAALVAARHHRKAIEAEDLNEAQDRVIAGPAKKDRVMSEQQRRTVAYHEAGHTVVGVVLNDARTVHKVTIVPRGRAGGYAIMLPKEDRFVVTKQELLDQVVGLLGGRVAEEIVFGTQSTGASNDFQQATQIIRRMITEYGMSDTLGTIQYEGNSSIFIGRDYGQRQAYSDQVAYEIDQEVRRMMQEAHDEAYRIIETHREQLNTIAEKLLEVETLDESEIKSLFETGEMPEKVAVNEVIEVDNDELIESEDEVSESSVDVSEEESTESLSKVRQALEDGDKLL